MIAHDFPCKICTHAAAQHFANISSDETVCVKCNDNKTGYIERGEEWHMFVGDNLKYMELRKKKQELLNEEI